MSPQPDRSSQPSKSPLPEETNPVPEQPAAVSESTPTEASTVKETPTDLTLDAVEGSPPASTTPLVPKRPLMRPVNRPQPPPVAQPVAAQVTTPQAAVAKAPLETVSQPPKPDAGVVQAETSLASTSEATAQTLRQQPIPPPSEPKQYRAIGLVRGRYTPSEEQFTRGAMITNEGTEVEAVLLGRVMSLVRNHLDLEQEHLWVVYPRTREMRQDLHVQIVGVWEPDKLNKAEEETEDAAELDTALETPPEPSPPAETASTQASDDSGLDENYFSIRGEVVFYSAEEQQIVVKIQQAPRKTADREKAFKLRLDGVLSSPKALGYFWDLQVERRSAALVVTSGTPIGLVPPKKKTASAGFKRGGDRRPPQRKTRPAGGGRGAAPTTSSPRREPLPKPVKRTEPTSEG
ncbi:MAG: hypothetical protein KME27_16160 [Lyngbya sp. HA4199-MV5]|nr:hypothetical protein [Lyngbya sp. HA4199-MV5]